MEYGLVSESILPAPSSICKYIVVQHIYVKENVLEVQVI